MTILEIILISILCYLVFGVIFAFATTRGGNEISNSETLSTVALWPLLILGVIGIWLSELLYWIGGKMGNKK